MVKIKYARPKILAGHLVGSRVPQFGNHWPTWYAELVLCVYPLSAAGLLLSARWAGDIDRLLHGRRSAACDCEQCCIVSARRKLNPDLLDVDLGDPVQLQFREWTVQATLRLRRNDPLPVLTMRLLRGKSRGIRHACRRAQSDSCRRGAVQRMCSIIHRSLNALPTPTHCTPNRLQHWHIPAGKWSRPEMSHTGRSSHRWWRDNIAGRSF